MPLPCPMVARTKSSSRICASFLAHSYSINRNPMKLHRLRFLRRRSNARLPVSAYEKPSRSILKIRPFLAVRAFPCQRAGRTAPARYSGCPPIVFLMRPCLRGALYNTHNMPCAGHFNPAFTFRKSQKCGRLPSLTSFFQNRIPRYGKMPFRRSENLRFGKSFLSNMNPPRFSAPANPRQNRRKKKRADIRRAPEKENRTIPYLEFSESPASSDSPPSPCAPLPSASSSSTSGMV